MSYEDFRQKWGPAWLRGEFGTEWQGAHGRVADALALRMKQGVKAAFPEECPADALTPLGAEIGIPRSPTDTDATYGEKLRRAWEVWPFAGTPLGMLLAFEAAGYPAGMVVVVQQDGNAFGLDTNTTLPADERLVVYDLMGTPARWTFDLNFAFWSKFGILFPDSTNLPTGWAAGAVSPPTAISTPTKETVNGLIRLVNKWRRSAATFKYIKVVTAGSVWGWPVTLEWGAPGLVWGGATVVEWSGTTEY